MTRTVDVVPAQSLGPVAYSDVKAEMRITAAFLWWMAVERP